MNNDIAIIRLWNDAIFDNYVRPICLWQENKTKLSEVIDKVGMVIGWGKTENGTTSKILRESMMPVVRVLECLESNREYFSGFLSETNFCAGWRNGELNSKKGQ